MVGDYSTDHEVQSLVAEFEARRSGPGASGLIFWPSDEFDHEPAAAQVVDGALSCWPIDL